MSPFFFSDHRIFGWGESLMCGLSDRTEVSMYIRRVVFAVVFLLITTGVAWAGKEAYKLVMSQDKQLCESMLAIFNADMKK